MEVESCYMVIDQHRMYTHVRAIGCVHVYMIVHVTWNVNMYMYMYVTLDRYIVLYTYTVRRTHNKYKADRRERALGSTRRS